MGKRVEGYTFGVDFRFEGFDAKVLEIDLQDPQYHRLQSVLEIWDHHPKKTLIVFEKKKPQFLVVLGDREIRDNIPGSIEETPRGDIPYLHVINIGSTESLFVHGRGYHKLGDRGGSVLNAEKLLPTPSQSAGAILITKDYNQFEMRPNEGRYFQLLDAYHVGHGMR